MKHKDQHADICLFLEGTYPYVSGGVATWAHHLISSQSDLTFHLVSLLPPGEKADIKYILPKNVVSLTNVYLQRLPKGTPFLPAGERKKLFSALEVPLLNMQSPYTQLKDLEKVIDALAAANKPLGSRIILDSADAWSMLLRMYYTTMGEHSFLDYFWSWRALLGGLFSVLLADLPDASCYHSLCTGYAGLFLARAKLETNRPCILTEHGIYTNERRIEIGSADWLDDQKALNFDLQPQKTMDRTLRDFWMDSFVGYSRMCYQAADHCITLIESNMPLQVADGATPEKLGVIANGIDCERFDKIKRDTNHPPTIALIGRVVPIKDIKTFIRACDILRVTVPGLRAYIIGPTDEDPHYHQECVEIVKHSNLDGTITFTGKVNIDEYLDHIDVCVLTSISESQPLVILEAGAVGIPSVVTDVGGCREMLMGRSDEKPALGPGGGIAALSNARSVAYEIEQLLSDKELYAQCSHAIRERVHTYYNKERQDQAYHALYTSLIQSATGNTTSSRKVG